MDKEKLWNRAAKAAEQEKPVSLTAINLKKIIVESCPLDVVSNIRRWQSQNTPFSSTQNSCDRGNNTEESP